MSAILWDMGRHPQPFADRKIAGIQLAEVIKRGAIQTPGLVLGLPRGGVPVAYEVARALGVPLDVMPVRKIGMPGNREFAIGAIAGKTVVRESNLAVQVPTRVFEDLARKERAELRRRGRIYRAGLPPLNLQGIEVLLVDDGLATGSTMLAAVREARRLKAEVVSVAAPVASDSAEALVRAEADKSVVLKIPVDLGSVGAWYDDFHPVEDSEVCELLAQSRPAAKPLSYAT
jgi:predicted phosphoribosyltransferase